MTDTPHHTKGRPATGAAALFASCPRCGAKTLFVGPVKFAERCNACSLNYAKFNVGDGPAAFLTMIVGAVVVALALWLQLTFEPPWWVHVILWLPLIVSGVVGGLRVSKAWLLTAEYRRSAEEHRIGKVDQR